jgi:hypothetical protein
MTAWVPIASQSVTYVSGVPADASGAPLGIAPAETTTTDANMTEAAVRIVLTWNPLSPIEGPWAARIRGSIQARDESRAEAIAVVQDAL